MRTPAARRDSAAMSMPPHHEPAPTRGEPVLSRGDLATCRRFSQALATGDVEAALAAAHRDIRLRTPRATFRGAAGVRAFLDAPPFEHLERAIVLERVDAEGARAVAVARVRLRWRDDDGDGFADERPVSAVMDVRDGLVIGWRLVLGRADGRAPINDPPRRPTLTPPTKGTLPMSRLRRQLSPTMLVALLALVLAATSTATAAVLINSPDQLGDDVVTNSKIATDAISARALGEPSVGSSHLTDQAVTNPKLATSAVDRRAIAPSAVDGSRLADRVVSNTKLVNPVFSASVEADGSTTFARTVGVDPSRTGKAGSPGQYQVAFVQRIDTCALVASAHAGFAEVKPSSRDPRVAEVITRDENAFTDGKAFLSPQSFSVIAQC
jgi:SnoaL-like domain